MTDTHSRPHHGPVSRGPADRPPTGPARGRPDPFGPAGPWTGVYPPPMDPSAPPPRTGKRPHTLLRVLLIVAAVVFGIPGVLVVVGIVAVAVNGAPSPAGSAPAAPPSVAPPTAGASPGPQAVSPSPPPEPDPLDPYDLAAGDCYNSVPLPADGTTVRISSVEPVACSQPHTAQVVARFAYSDLVWSEATESRSTADCERSFRDLVSRKVLADDRYQAGRIYSGPALPGLQSVFAACVIATEAPTTGSVLKG